MIPEAEAPGRLVKQLALLAEALSVVRGEAAVSLGTYLTVVQVAQDSMPAPRRVVLEAVLARPDAEPPTTTDVAEATGYPTSTTRLYLQELTALRLVTRRPEGPGRADRWAPSPRLHGLLTEIAGPGHPTRNVRGGVVSE